MNEVVDLQAARAERTPHVSGKARCMGCKHEWVAVAPIGMVTDLECPSCESMKGVMRFACEPADGLKWICNCGNDLFMLTDKGAPFCVNCGTRATGWVES